MDTDASSSVFAFSASLQGTLTLTNSCVRSNTLSEHFIASYLVVLVHAFGTMERGSRLDKETNFSLPFECSVMGSTTSPHCTPAVPPPTAMLPPVSVRLTTADLQPLFVLISSVLEHW